MKKGTIILIPFPFTDFSGMKTRPALILATDIYDVTVAFITSKIIKQEPHDLEILPTETNGLRVESIIKLNKLATIDKELILGELRVLSESDIKAIDKKLIAVFNISI